MTQPPLDMHAHIDTAIPGQELEKLGSVVFAATRSLDEAAAALSRVDPQVCWGVGCHPQLATAQKAFDPGRFSELTASTAFVSEVGLDGTSPVAMEVQRATLSAILAVLAVSPRITSIHSYEATEDVLATLDATPIRGAVLHWWLGDTQQTRRALDLGCYFSVNASSVRRTDLLDLIPLDRLLTETDHPYGDRRGGVSARPGGVDSVERALAEHFRTDKAAVREAMWRNLAGLIRQADCASLLPRRVRLRIIAG